MARPSSPTAGFAASVRTGASPVCPCAARTFGCPAGTVRIPGGLRSPASAALSGCATREGSWGSGPSQPKDPSFLALWLPHPLAPPAQSGAQPGAPAQPPVGWAWPLGCPTRTSSAAWRPSAASACSGPVHLPGAAAHGTAPSRAGLGIWGLRDRTPQQASQRLGPEQKADGPSSRPWLGNGIQALEDQNVHKPSAPSGP